MRTGRIRPAAIGIAALYALLLQLFGAAALPHPVAADSHVVCRPGAAGSEQPADGRDGTPDCCLAICGAAALALPPAGPEISRSVRAPRAAEPHRTLDRLFRRASDAHRARGPPLLA